MIRAVVREGKIQPLAPLPEDWSEGREMRIEAEEREWAPEEIERWRRDMEAGAATIDTEDVETINRAVAEADKEAKDSMRREMEVS